MGRHAQGLPPLPNIPQNNLGHQTVPGGASGDPSEVGPADQLPPLVTQSRIIGSVVKDEPDAVKPRRYQAVGIPRDGIVLLENGRHVRVPPGKIFDERYHNIPFLKQQGIELKELSES